MDDEDQLQKLQKEIASIKQTLDEAKTHGLPLNEADTEHKIIDPLLHVLGYSPLQISKHGHDSVVHNFPDYTLWPNFPSPSQKWFLEAKKLDHPLQDGEAAQAVNYANNQGAEWAVLTNGRKWFIYNAHLPKPLTEKRVFQITDLFADSQGAKALALLSRQEMLSNGLTKAWLFARISALVKEQINTPNSVLRKTLRKLAMDETKAQIPDQLIGDVLATLSSFPTPPAFNSQKSVVTCSEKVKATPSTGPSEPDPLYTLDQLTKPEGPATGKKGVPGCVEIVFASGETTSNLTWKNAARHIVEKIGSSYGLPALPFAGTGKGKGYFLNTEPLHANGSPMKQPATCSIKGQTVYIDTNRSASYLSKTLTALFEAVGVSLEAVKVKIG